MIKSIKLSDYFKLIKPHYITIKITPHKSIRNYNSSNIAKAIAHTYRSINKRIYKKQKQLFFETEFKISYVIDIFDNNTNFYFIVPKPFKNIIIEKIKEIWNKATIEEVEGGITPLSTSAEYWELSYKKEDALSLDIDKKSNEPLNSILSVLDIMKDDDRITLVYNFMPSSQFGWIDRYEQSMDKIRKRKCVDKTTISATYIAKISLQTVLKALDGVFDVLNDLLGGKPIEDKESLYSSIMGVLEQQGDLSPATKRKKEATVLQTQIGMISESSDLTRRENNSLAVCQAFRTLDSDNELKYSKCKNKFNFNDYSLNTKSSTFSTDEISNFIQIPGRLLLTKHRINHIKTEENQVPKELQEGYLKLGTVKYKGAETNAYIENEYNKGNLPLVLVGSQGSGKSEYIKNITKYCIKNNEGVIVLDFIKSCNLSETISSITPKDKLVKLNMAKESDIQGLGYNEMIITGNMTAFEKLDLASKQTQQIMNLVDSISVGDPLSSRMRRYLSSAAKIVICQGDASVKNVIDCLENYKKRQIYINGLSLELKSFLEDELNTLEELNEWSKVSKKEQSEGVEAEIVGTNTSKIEHILDRVSMLREDFKMKYMYNKSCDNNINLVNLMNEGKVVLIQMKEDDFSTKMIKNIMVTYWVSKVWLTSQIRGGIMEKPLRTNFVIDEIFQAPTSLNMMNYIIPQSRKFGLHAILSTQYIKQLDGVFESLEASGSSFMLLKGCNENDFNHFKAKFDGIFEYEDLRDMEEFSSMNLINYSGGYSSFITKLPKPISN